LPWPRRAPQSRVNAREIRILPKKYSTAKIITTFNKPGASMRGRRPTPSHLRLLQGNPQHRPINKNEPQPPPVATVEAPDYLAGYALDEWHRIAAGLRVMGLLTELDIHILAAYCIAYGRWREVEEKLAELREKDPVTRGLLIEGRINPLVKLSRNCAAELLRFAGEFGFTPAARTRIGLGVGVPDNGKFGDLI
jgi:P27 family predicted phage terminase small subunit